MIATTSHGYLLISDSDGNIQQAIKASEVTGYHPAGGERTGQTIVERQGNQMGMIFAEVSPSAFGSAWLHAMDQSGAPPDAGLCERVEKLETAFRELNSNMHRHTHLALLGDNQEVQDIVESIKESTEHYEYLGDHRNTRG